MKRCDYCKKVIWPLQKSNAFLSKTFHHMCGWYYLCYLRKRRHEDKQGTEGGLEGLKQHLDKCLGLLDLTIIQWDQGYDHNDSKYWKESP
jgi:hypothetical protein